jgi:hypothetical protein
MELKLTYDGLLLGASRTNTRAQHKHDIRRQFHPQLRRFWETHAILRRASARMFLPGKWQLTNSLEDPGPLLWEGLAEKYERMGYNFVPLARQEAMVICSVRILFLRIDPPGSLISSGDIDNRLKTLFDALRMPKDKDEVGGNAPSVDEKPFYVLLEDDRLITHLSIETDTLLQRVGDSWDDNHVRLVISVRLKSAYGMLLYD